MESDKLKNCPFCGGHPKIIRENNQVPAPSWQEFATIQCWSCGIAMSSSADAGTLYDMTDEHWKNPVKIEFNEEKLIAGVVKRWNTRHRKVKIERIS